MTVVLEREVVRTCTLPTIRREGITWRTEGENVVVSIELYNDSWESTSEDILVIEAAPFGAFVPNVPITAIAVGSLDPGERRTESVALSRDMLERIASMGVPDGLMKFHRAMTALLDAGSHTHWIGNLNVYFHTQPGESVERHCAFGLRVPTKSTIAAMFMIYGADDCSFQVSCSENDWSGEILSPAPWALLAVAAPHETGKRAKVTVDVRRSEDGKVVPVEFEFETVDGWGEALGCVKV